MNSNYKNVWVNWLAATDGLSIGIFFAGDSPLNYASYVRCCVDDQEAAVMAITKAAAILNGVLIDKVRFHVQLSDVIGKLIEQKIPQWVSSSWITENGTPVVNKGILQALVNELTPLTIEWVQADSADSFGSQAAQKLAMEATPKQ